MCKYLPQTKYVFHGWGCCRCQTFNGLQRLECKRCGTPRCAGIPTAESKGLCPVCGVPKGVACIGPHPQSLEVH